MKTHAQSHIGNKVFTLEGLGLDLEGDLIYLFYMDEKGVHKKDSAKVDNGAFKFKGKIVEPTVATISISSSGSGDPMNTLHPIFLEPTQLKVILKRHIFPSCKLQGSAVHDAYWHHEKSKKEIHNKLKKLSEKYDKVLSDQKSANPTNTTFNDSIIQQLQLVSAQIVSYKRQLVAIDTKYIRSFPKSFVAAFLLQQYFHILPVDELEEHYNNMYPLMQQGQYGRALKEAIEVRKNKK